MAIDGKNVLALQEVRHRFTVPEGSCKKGTGSVGQKQAKYYITNCCTVVYKKYFCSLASSEPPGLIAEGPPSDFAPPCKIGIQAPAVPVAHGVIKHPALRGCGVFFESNPNTVPAPISLRNQILDSRSDPDNLTLITR